MRMTPVKTGPVLRRIRVKIRMWEIGLRMKEVHGNPDVWMLGSPKPAVGSPWHDTQEYGTWLEQVGPINVCDLAEVEALLRFYAAHDYFDGLRAVTRTRRVYSLYILCRSTIEACAFAAWIFDPTKKPATRLLRGLLLQKQSLVYEQKSLEREERDQTGPADASYLAEVAEAQEGVATRLRETEQAIENIRADAETDDLPTSKGSLAAPHLSTQVRQMLCDDLGMPQGFVAYDRMSGVAHSRALAIIGTWNSDGGKPSIDYYDFLVYLHLALCSIDFCLARRSECWGTTYKSSRLRKIIARIGDIIEGEPEVKTL